MTWIQRKQLVKVEQLKESIARIHKPLNSSASSKREQTRERKNKTKGIIEVTYDKGEYVLEAKRDCLAGEKLLLHGEAKEEY